MVGEQPSFVLRRHRRSPRSTFNLFAVNDSLGLAVGDTKS
jgi:hypothetical protein